MSLFEKSSHVVYQGDNLDILRDEIQDESVDLIYIDPPFNTGKSQVRQQISYDDTFESDDDYISFLEERIIEASNKLTSKGSFFLHVDYRQSHYCKVMLDNIFGRNCFMNEIIWAYDYGGRPKTRWPAKHDNIFWYVIDPAVYTFNHDKMERIPYMAPGLVGKEKEAKGKTPTDVWWHTIVPTNGTEKTGYPTQKPLGIINRIISVHSKVGDTVLDFFAGSGTTGESAAMHSRNSILIDKNPDAIKVIMQRMQLYSPELRENETV